MLPPMMDGDQFSSSREQMYASWEAQRSRSNDAYGVGGSSFAPPLGHNGGMVPPPGIPESGPFLDHHTRQHIVPGMRSHSLNLPTQSSCRLLPALGSFSASSTDFGTGNLACLGTVRHLRVTMAHSTTWALVAGDTRFGLLLRLQIRLCALVAWREHQLLQCARSCQTHLQSLDSFGFGSDLNHKPLDSSIIDSISTGNTAIGGTALWGGSAVQATGGSSLLGNIINASSGYQQEISHHQHHHQNEPDSLFSNLSFQPCGASWERDCMNYVQSSDGGGSGSIW